MHGANKHKIQFSIYFSADISVTNNSPRCSKVKQQSSYNKPTRCNINLIFMDPCIIV